MCAVEGRLTVKYWCRIRTYSEGCDFYYCHNDVKIFRFMLSLYLSGHQPQFLLQNAHLTVIS